MDKRLEQRSASVAHVVVAEHVLDVGDSYLLLVQNFFALLLLWETNLCPYMVTIIDFEILKELSVSFIIYFYHIFGCQNLDTALFIDKVINLHEFILDVFYLGVIILILGFFLLLFEQNFILRVKCKVG